MNWPTCAPCSARIRWPSGGAAASIPPGWTGCASRPRRRWRGRAATALLGRRDELRGLLDAYQAKAARLGAAEDIELAAHYRQASDLLWTAPCDLAAATAAVTRYQQAILALSERRQPR